MNEAKENQIIVEYMDTFGDVVDSHTYDDGPINDNHHGPIVLALAADDSLLKRRHYYNRSLIKKYGTDDDYRMYTSALIELTAIKLRKRQSL